MRQEYKYLVPISKLDKMRNALKPFVKIDPFAENRDNKEYSVKSIYFDSVELDDYNDKIEGYKIRKKIRIRGYNEFHGLEKIVYLEIKRKSESYNSKNRAPLLYSDLKEMIKTGNVEKFVLPKNKLDKHYKRNTNDAKKFCYHLYMKTLRPIILVVYEREPFFSSFDNRVRLTFDKNLRYLVYPTIEDLYDEKYLHHIMSQYFILEVKFDFGFPRWMQNILTNFNLNRRALSKYTICLDAYKKLTPINSHTKYAFTNSKFIHWEEYSE